MIKFVSFFALVVFFSACADHGESQGGQVSNEQDMALYGKKIYITQCSVCHGEKGNAKIAMASDLTISKLNETEIGDRVYHGKGGMPPFKDRLGEPEVLAVSKYVISLKVSE